jgi:hypothetical protein
VRRLCADLQSERGEFREPPEDHRCRRSRTRGSSSRPRTWRSARPERDQRKHTLKVSPSSSGTSTLRRFFPEYAIKSTEDGRYLRGDIHSQAFQVYPLVKIRLIRGSVFI